MLNKLLFHTILTILVLLVFAQSNVAQPVDLTFHSIPDSLKVNADAIVRYAKTEIEIKNNKTAVLKEQYYITILNANGKDKGHFFEVYDQSRKIKNFNAAIYDLLGNRVQRFRNKDLQDRSLVSDFSLFEDSRIKYLEIHRSQYPFTVMVEYEVEYDGYAHFPRWVPQGSSRLAVQKSELMVKHPENFPIRHLTLNTSEADIQKTASGALTYNWQVSNLNALQIEPLSPPYHEFRPVVFLGPKDFIFHNSSGSLTSWNEYGQWVSTLIQGRQDLPETTIKHIQALTVGLEDNPLQAARLVYEYMQSQTRYVSIQLGIGGFQPLPAATVANTGYGDCKALSNYTKALLNAAGIDSYYAEIGVNNQSIFFEDFPSLDQTNHAILFVPIDGDTIWMECTSQRLPFGYIPSSLQNRKALVVNDERSTLLRVPAYDADKNQINFSMNVDIQNDGTGLAQFSSIYRGVKIENTFPEVWQNRQEQEKAILSRYSLPGSTLISFALALDELTEISAVENVTMHYANFGSITGKRMFLPVYPFRASGMKYSTVQNRKTDFVIPNAYTTKAVLYYNLSDQFDLESLPGPVNISSPYGTYRLAVKQTEENIQVVREYSLNKGRFPAAEYQDFVAFHQAIFSADRLQIVLLAD